MKKRLLSMLLVLAMVLSLAPAIGIGAMAAEIPTEVSTEAGLSTGGYLKLTQDITLTENTTIPANTTIILDNHSITKGSYSLTLGEGDVFVIGCETDLTNAVSYLKGQSSNYKAQFELSGDFGLSHTAAIEVPCQELTIDGKGYKISGKSNPDTSFDENTTSYVLQFTNGSDNTSVDVALTNITVTTSDQFERCVGVNINSNKVSLTLNGNVMLDNKVAHTGSKGACLIDNGCDVTVKGNCQFITGTNSYSAIDVSGKYVSDTAFNATLTFDDSANVYFEDNRANDTKTKKPLVNMDPDSNSTSTVNKPENAGLEYMEASGSREKNGYDLCVATVKHDGSTVCYDTFADAVSAAATNNGTNTIKLCQNVTLATDTTIPDNTTIILNRHWITKRFTLGEGVVFVIGCETDLRNAVSYLEGQSSNYEAQFELSANFGLYTTVGINVPCQELTIDGKGYKISGKSNLDTAFNKNTRGNVLNFNNTSSDKASVNVILKNISVATSNEFEKCICVENNSKRVSMTLDSATLDNAAAHTSADRPFRGACLVCNAGDITVKGNCKFITGENSWAAISVDGKSTGASVTFDSANVTFVDNRTDAKKVNEPLVGIEGSNVNIANYASVGLGKTTKAAMNPNDTAGLRCKDGYDIAVAKIGTDYYYGSMADAVAAVTDSTATTIKLLSDVIENITVDSGKNITLDLNGKVLKASSGSVITNKGTLTVKDTATTDNTHYFKVNADGLWVLDDKLTEADYTFDAENGLKTAADGKASADIPAANKVIKVTGGCITGGNIIGSGGGIDSMGILTVSGGNIVGNHCSNAGGGGGINSETIESSITALTITGGAVCGNTAGSAGNGTGGGVYFKDNNSTFLFSGGEVSYNIAGGYAGGIRFNQGTFTMSGTAKIKGNRAQNCGGLQYSYYLSCLNLLGGEISGNVASVERGGVAVDVADITVSVGGNMRITGNTANGKVRNLDFVKNYIYIVIPNGANAPTKDMLIGVSLSGETGKFTTNGTEADKQYFFSDEDGYIVKYVAAAGGTAAHLELAYAVEVTANGTTKDYKSIADALKHGGEDASIIETGEEATNPTVIKLLGNVTENVTIPAGRFITLDLNGKVLKAANAGGVITNNGTLTVKDSDTDAEHYFNYVDNGAWMYYGDNEPTEGTPDIDTVDTIDADTDYVKVLGGIITGGINTEGGDTVSNATEFQKGRGGGVRNNGTLTMDGGNIVGNKARYGGGVYNDVGPTIVTTRGIFTVNGGSIIGNSTTAKSGGGICNCAGTLKITDGLIAYNFAETVGGGVYNTYSFTMTGGTIKNCTAKQAGGAVCSNGKEGDPEKPLDTKFVFEDGEITGCTVSTVTETHTANESVCISNSTMTMKGGKLSGKIFSNDTPTECVITISGGYFNYASLVVDATTWAGKAWLAEDYKIAANTDTETKTAYPFIVTKNQKTICIYSAPLAAGDEAQLLILGGKEAGEFTISGDSKNGFTLKNDDGKFISYAGGTLKTDSSTAYTWKYDGGLYAETKTTTRSGFWWWSKVTTKVTKTYLTFDGNSFGTSCCKVCAEVQVTDNEHTWAYLHDGDGKHEAYCTKCGHHEQPEEHKYDKDTHLCVCGKLDPKQCYVSDVEVTEQKTTSCTGWWIFTRKITKYQYTIKPIAQNVCVSKVEYSGNGEKWNTGTVFTSDVKLNEFYIRVTDSNGKVTNWKYENGDVKNIDEPEYEDQSALWWDYDNVGSAKDLESIKFDTEVPAGYAEGENWATWDTPANSKAYYDKVNHAVTYVLLSGTKFVFDNGSLFRSRPNSISEEKMLIALNADLKPASFEDMDELDEFISDLNAFIAAVENDDADDILTLANKENINAFLFGDAIDADMIAMYEQMGILDGMAEECLEPLVIIENVRNGEDNHMFGVGASTKAMTVTGLELFDVSGVTDFSQMFRDLSCETLDVSDFDVSAGENFKGMFRHCDKLTTIDLSTWDTRNAVDVSWMFYYCEELTSIQLGENFTLENAKDMSHMFSDTWKLATLDVSDFDTSNAENMSGMFGCPTLTSLDVSGFDTGNVTDMSGMFRNCSSLAEIDISAFDTSSVTDMSNMFSMTDDNHTLKHIYVGTDWSVDNVTDSENMFLNCCDLPHFDASSVDKTYAYVGDPNGYLETKEPV